LLLSFLGLYVAFKFSFAGEGFFFLWVEEEDADPVLLRLLEDIKAGWMDVDVKRKSEFKIYSIISQPRTCLGMSEKKEGCGVRDTGRL